MSTSRFFFASRFGNDGTRQQILLQPHPTECGTPRTLVHAEGTSLGAPPVLPSILKLPTRRKKCPRIRSVSWL